MTPWGGLPVGVAIGSVGAEMAWWLESARRLDEAGYAGAWCWDHVMGKGDPTVPVLEQWTTLAAAAAVTRRIGIGSWVSNVMNRHPAMLARMAGTVQAISGGRLTLGIGIGGFPREHRAYGIDFPDAEERAARLEEAIGVIRALWTGGPVTVPGRFYALDEAVAFPRPEPAPRILVGAGTPAGVRLAARAGDGWAAESDTYESLRDRYLEALAAAGRSRGDVRIVVGFGGGRTGVDALSGSPWLEAPGETADRWAALGADEIVLTARTTADIDRLVAAAGR
ncbi:MAG TPA: LLM class flavin-dependent oxidoreductase [Candidatus Limnocylindrales bacterium]|nr:LLM class flavin-dependent oxidoreductase [Candidatus Limnocylindrales bacterium]